MVLAMLIAFTNCNKENSLNPNGNGSTLIPDPEGTIIKSLLNENNGKTKLNVGSGDGYLYIDAANNFYGWRANVCCIGQVNGLAAITSVPENGWGNTSALPGYGYIAFAPNPYTGKTDYIRIYVVEYIRSGEKITGVIVKYQDPFVPENIQNINE